MVNEEKKDHMNIDYVETHLDDLQNNNSKINHINKPLPDTEDQELRAFLAGEIGGV